MKNTSDQLYFQYLLLQLFRKSNDQDIHWRHCPYMKASKKMEGVALSYSIYGSVQFVCMAELFILLKRALDEKKHNCSRDAPDFSNFFYSMTYESCTCQFSYHGEIINEHTRTFVVRLKNYRNAK